MIKFENFTGVVAGIDRPNIDTDAIIPKQYLKSIKRTGFGPNLFDDWRYLDPGEPGQDNSARRLNPDFVLNQPPFDAAEVLLARENFACGSSREHAVWALLDFGLKVVIAPSFADIFYNNSFKNGFLPIMLDADSVDQLFGELSSSASYALAIDLEKQLVTTPGGIEFSFEIDEFRKFCLLNGLDDIGLTMQHVDAIRSFEDKYYASNPWLGQAK
jgi:3-isopropylmalate/(R)-2-methylmalate dehydratase small subunit